MIRPTSSAIKGAAVTHAVSPISNTASLKQLPRTATEALSPPLWTQVKILIGQLLNARDRSGEVKRPPSLQGVSAGEEMATDFCHVRPIERSVPRTNDAATERRNLKGQRKRSQIRCRNDVSALTFKIAQPQRRRHQTISPI